MYDARCILDKDAVFVLASFLEPPKHRTEVGHSHSSLTSLCKPSGGDSSGGDSLAKYVVHWLCPAQRSVESPLERVTR